MKISLIQFNPTVGDLKGNRDLLIAKYREAEASGAELVIAPEMAITGYPIEDLAQSRAFVEAAQASADLLIASLKDGKAGIIFGTLLDNGRDHRPSNGAILYDPQSDDDPQRVVKYELPNYGVFDEKRVFEGARPEELKPVMFRDNKIGLMICEDAWFDEVTQRLCQHGVPDLFVSINGSPYEIEKNLKRIGIIRQRLQQVFKTNTVSIPFIYNNLVGGQDELVFDGGSFVISQRGLDQFPFFQSGVYDLDVDLGHTNDWELFEVAPTGIAETYAACVTGLRDYLGKQHFETVVLGMSGGVDSGIVAALAVDAFGADKVNLVRLPSRFSSKGSLKDAETANDRLGTQMRTIPIEPVVEALRASYEAGFGYDVAKDHPKLTGVADENIQARARGVILMAISNQEGHLLLTTGNKSEVSVGYSTLYGDMAGGFNPIKDCYKTTVWEMCRYRNALKADDIKVRGYLGTEGEIIPEEIITKPPSAELREDQKDADSLPPYDVLDSILKKMIECDMSVKEIEAAGFDLDTVVRVRTLLDRAEYKRRQAAPGVKITSKLHGRERRVPIVNAFTGSERDD